MWSLKGEDKLNIAGVPTEEVIMSDFDRHQDWLQRERNLNEAKEAAKKDAGADLVKLGEIYEAHLASMKELLYDVCKVEK